MIGSSRFRFFGPRAGATVLRWASWVGPSIEMKLESIGESGTGSEIVIARAEQ